MPVHVQEGAPKVPFSNQHQIDLPNVAGTHAFETKNGNLIHVTAPFCDWLTLTAPICISDVFQSATSQGEDPVQYLAQLMGDARVTLGQTAKKGADEELAFKFKTRMAGYATGHKRLGPDNASTGFFVASRLNKHQTSYQVRINLNPARLTSAGLSEIDTIFTLLFGQEMNINTWLGRAKYTRIDAALDVINMDVTDLIFHEHKASKWSCFHDASFGLETFSRLKKTNKGNWKPEVRVYNKAKQLEDNGKTPPYGALPHTRIEVTKSTQRRFRDLLSLPNPVDDLTMGYLPDIAAAMPCGFRNFVHASMRVGLQRALDDVPLHQRDSFAAALNGPPATFWEPKTIWSSWKDGLAQSGLLKWIEKAKGAANDEA